MTVPSNDIEHQLKYFDGESSTDDKGIRGGERINNKGKGISEGKRINGKGIVAKRIKGGVNGGKGNGGKGINGGKGVKRKKEDSESDSELSDSELIEILVRDTSPETTPIPPKRSSGSSSSGGSSVSKDSSKNKVYKKKAIKTAVKKIKLSPASASESDETDEGLQTDDESFDFEAASKDAHFLSTLATNIDDNGGDEGSDHGDEGGSSDEGSADEGSDDEGSDDDDRSDRGDHADRPGSNSRSNSSGVHDSDSDSDDKETADTNVTDTTVTDTTATTADISNVFYFETLTSVQESQLVQIRAEIENAIDTDSLEKEDGGRCELENALKPLLKFPSQLTQVLCEAPTVETPKALEAAPTLEALPVTDALAPAMEAAVTREAGASITEASDSNPVRDLIPSPSYSIDVSASGTNGLQFIIPKLEHMDESPANNTPHCVPMEDSDLKVTEFETQYTNAERRKPRAQYSVLTKLRRKYDKQFPYQVQCKVYPCSLVMSVQNMMVHKKEHFLFDSNNGKMYICPFCATLSFKFNESKKLYSHYIKCIPKCSPYMGRPSIPSIKNNKDPVMTVCMLKAQEKLLERQMKMVANIEQQMIENTQLLRNMNTMFVEFRNSIEALPQLIGTHSCPTCPHTHHQHPPTYYHGQDAQQVVQHADNGGRQYAQQFNIMDNDGQYAHQSPVQQQPNINGPQQADEPQQAALEYENLERFNWYQYVPPTANIQSSVPYS